MQPAHRRSDIGSGHSCHFPPTLATGGSPNIFVNNKPLMRVSYSTGAPSWVGEVEDDLSEEVLHARSAALSAHMVTSLQGGDPTGGGMLSWSADATTGRLRLYDEQGGSDTG